MRDKTGGRVCCVLSDSYPPVYIFKVDGKWDRRNAFCRREAHVLLQEVFGISSTKALQWLRQKSMLLAGGFSDLASEEELVHAPGALLPCLNLASGGRLRSATGFHEAVMQHGIEGLWERLKLPGRPPGPYGINHGWKTSTIHRLYLAHCEHHGLYKLTSMWAMASLGKLGWERTRVQGQCGWCLPIQRNVKLQPLEATA